MRYEGQVIWKCGLEYNPQGKLLGGDPYYYITRVKNYQTGVEKYNLLKLNPENSEYIVIKTVDKDKYDELNEEAMMLWENLYDILFPKNKYGERNYYYHPRRDKDFKPIIEEVKTDE